MTFLPVFGGQPAAVAWPEVLRQARVEASVGAAWVIGGLGLGIAAVVVNRRRSWWAYAFLATAVLGIVGMASPMDPVTLITGVTQ